MTLWERRNSLYVAADKSLVRRVPAASDWSPSVWASDQLFEYDVVNATVVGGKATTLINTAPIGVDAVQVTVSKQAAYDASHAALNNRPAIYFAGAQNYDMTGISAPTYFWTLFLVLNNVESPKTTEQYIFDQGLETNTIALTSNLVDQSAIYTPVRQHLSISPTGATCWIITTTSTTFTAYWNGVIDPLTPITAPTKPWSGQVTLGSYFFGTSDFVESCYLAYFMGLSRTISSAEAVQFSDWSRERYATP